MAMVQAYSSRQNFNKNYQTIEAKEFMLNRKAQQNLAPKLSYNPSEVKSLTYRQGKHRSNLSLVDKTMRNSSNRVLQSGVSSAKNGLDYTSAH